MRSNARRWAFAHRLASFCVAWCDGIFTPPEAMGGIFISSIFVSAIGLDFEPKAMKKSAVKHRRTRAALASSLVPLAALAAFALAGCNSCIDSDKDKPAPPAPEPVQGYGGPGSKPPIHRQQTIRLSNPALQIATDGGAPSAPESD
jgi:hypothetical protein